MRADKSDDYLGWVEEYHVGKSNSKRANRFVLLDLLHPGEVKSLQAGKSVFYDI